MATLFTDNFTGSDNTPWDPTKWVLGRNPTAGGGAVIIGGNGRLSSGTTGGYSPNDKIERQFNITPVADLDIRLDFQIAGEVYPDVFARSSDATEHGVASYIVTLTNGAPALRKVTAFSSTLLAQASTAAVANTVYKLRFRLAGTTIQAKFWTAGGTEPSTWNIGSVTDSTITAAGRAGIGLAGGGPAGVSQSMYLNDVTVTDIPAAGNGITKIRSGGGWVAPKTRTGGAWVNTGRRTRTGGAWDTVTPVVASRRNQIGVAISAANLHYNGGGTTWMNARLDDVVAFGAGRVRTDANWAWMEGTQGSISWTNTDALVAACQSRGLKLTLCIQTSPSWARAGGAPETSGPDTLTRRNAYAAFCTALANRYVGQVDSYELWNEPNLTTFWLGPNAANYVAMVKAAYPALKAAAPAATVILGGTAGVEDDGTNIKSTTWYTALYAAGIKGYFDAACVHPYQWWEAASATTPDSGELQRSIAVRTTMNSNGDSAVPMWGTEFGIPTGGTYAVTETQQSQALSGGRTVWFSRETGPLFLYTLRDTATPGASTSSEAYFGLQRSDNTTKKPVWTEFSTWMAS